MKNFLIIGFFIVALYSLINLVNAISVGGIYSTTNPLEISSGEEKTIIFSLQNRAGDGDVKFKGNVTKGQEIVSLVDKKAEYFVPGSPDSEVLVEVLVKIPRNVEIGKEYDVKIEFKSISIGDSGEGMVQMAVGLSRYFKVKVIGEEKIDGKKVKERKNLIWIILGIVIVIVMIVIVKFVFENKKTSSEYNSNI